MIKKKGTEDLNIDRLPPQDTEAENSLLGSLLLDKDAILKVADFVSPSDFYLENNAKIYDVMLELFKQRTPIDVVTLTSKLKGKKVLNEIGGASYITNLVGSVPSAAHVSHYGKIVAGKSTLRRLINASAEITKLGYEEKSDIDDVLDEAEQRLFSVSQKHFRQNFIPIKSILSESFDRIDELHQGEGKLRGIPTHYSDLDNLLAGLQRSDLIILAGRPSMGKTSLALNIATNIAIKEELTVGIFSLEMSKEQLVDRLLCSEAGVDSWKLRTGNLSDEDFPKIGHAMGVLSEASIFIDDSVSTNVMEIRTKARRLQAEHGLGLVVVDYLQLMEGRYSENRVQEISEISRSLKGLARELEIPVVALSQLSRAVEQRPDKIPQLSDLRESGSIEQDADVVMFIFREDYYKPDTDRKFIADILIKKHRNGPVGQIELFFKPEQMKFKNLEKKHKAEII